MKRMQKILFIIVATALGLIVGLGTAQAQVTSTGTNQGIVDLTLQGTIQSALVLAINGAGLTSLTATGSNVMPVVSTANVNFGTFNTQSTSLTNGIITRSTAGTAGAFIIAQLAAIATYSGNATGPLAANINLTLGAAGGSSPIDNASGYTRVQRTPATWTNPASSGSAVSATAVSICPNGNTTTGDCASGVTQAHELSVFVPDTQAAGTFTQVVTYTATAY